ncbi:hypothetical protein OOK13_41475 [Streptomyces sp. NBC_00378]|uniref:hypothetical protein n=1 Tax=unclassified Streptomyces TaxID=2593676 RepID=UPI002257207D|nr:MULTISPECIES: hypothetical protein [unclassified Streptomyces]MCX5114813.1 hypothetical protein [Streptomyces sp. NBC_00378]
MNTSAEPERTRSNAIASGPPIRQLFRDVIADRLPGPGPPQAAMLFDTEVDPYWDDQSFLADFYNEILHQDTCQPATADGLALAAALAVDDRIPARHRFQAVDLLFSAATVAERHLAEAWPAAPSAELAHLVICENHAASGRGRCARVRGPNCSVYRSPGRAWRFSP